MIVTDFCVTFSLADKAKTKKKKKKRVGVKGGGRGGERQHKEGIEQFLPL